MLLRIFGSALGTGNLRFEFRHVEDEQLAPLQVDNTAAHR
jgi:hypothetical protein